MAWDSEKLTMEKQISETICEDFLNYEQKMWNAPNHVVDVGVAYVLCATHGTELQLITLL